MNRVAASLWASSETAHSTGERALRWGQETGLLWIGGVFAVLFVLHLLASWAEKRGWIYYRREGTGGAGTAMSNALAEFDAILNPATEHRLQEERSQRIIATETNKGRLKGDDADEAVWFEVPNFDHDPEEEEAGEDF